MRSSLVNVCCLLIIINRITEAQFQLSIKKYSLFEIILTQTGVPVLPPGHSAKIPACWSLLNCFTPKGSPQNESALLLQCQHFNANAILSAPMHKSICLENNCSEEEKMTVNHLQRFNSNSLAIF